MVKRRDIGQALGETYAAWVREHGSHTLEIADVCQQFQGAGGETVRALDNVSFTIDQPEIVGIVGPSGCGKSTLLRLLAGLDAPASGTLTFDGAPIEGPHYERGLVFQDAALYDWLTVEENIAFGLRARGVYDEKKDRVAELIAQMGLTGFEKSYPYQISGGMASRTALARTFIQEPGLVLLDEPLSALDAFTRAIIQDQIVDMHLKSDALFVLVTHDIEEAVYLCDRIVVMSARPGRVVDEVTVDLAHPRDRVGTEFVEKRKEVLARFKELVDFSL